VDIKNASGEIIKTKVIGPDNGVYEQRKKYDESIDVSVAGDFSIILTNLCPSAQGKNRDHVIILSVEWTGYSE